MNQVVQIDVHVQGSLDVRCNRGDKRQMLHDQIVTSDGFIL